MHTTDTNFKNKLEKLCENSENLRTDLDQISSLSMLKGTKEEFEESLNHFFGITDLTKGKAQKVLFQLVLSLEVLINKMVAMDKFKVMHLIAKLSAKGEDVDVHIEQYSSIDYFNGKRMNLYFEILNKLLKHTGEAKTVLVKQDIQEPGIHVSGTFQEYLQKQVGCKITEEFANYIHCILNQGETEASEKLSKATGELNSEISTLIMRNSTLASENTDLKSKISSMSKELSSKSLQISDLQKLQILNSETQEQIGSKDKILALKDREIANLQEMYKNEENLVKELYADNKELELKRAEDVTTIQSLNLQLSKLRDEIANAHFQKREAEELDKLRQTLSDTRDQKDRTETELKTVKSEFAQVLSRFNKQDIELKDKVSQCEKLQKSIQQLMGEESSVSKSDIDKVIIL